MSPAPGGSKQGPDLCLHPCGPGRPSPARSRLPTPRQGHLRQGAPKCGLHVPRKNYKGQFKYSLYFSPPLGFPFSKTVIFWRSSAKLEHSKQLRVEWPTGVMPKHHVGCHPFSEHGWIKLPQPYQTKNRAFLFCLSEDPQGCQFFNVLLQTLQHCLPNAY